MTPRNAFMALPLAVLACDKPDEGLSVRNTPPVVRFEAPIEGESFQVAEVIEFVATVIDSESDSDQLELEWTSTVDGLLDDGASPSADGSATFATAGLSNGLHTITLKATDHQGLIGSDYMTVRVESDCLPDPSCDDDEDGYTEEEGDCNDANSAVFPGAEEVANGVDDDCDGVIDEGSDGYDDDGDGYTELGGDCDDSDPLVSPVGIEVCGDEVDNDCDSYVDDEDTDTDEDGDGYSQCEGPEQDCDDDDADVHPTAVERCGDDIDNDCDGDVDAADTDTDSDGDGHSACAGDCDDTRPDVFPGGTEVCDAAGLVDEDCDGAINEPGAVGSATYYLDGDGDGHGGSTGIDACELPAGYTPLSTDCDDENPDAHPGATEVCDDADNDCDGVTDESSAADAPTWYYDGDGDEFGSTPHVACTAPSESYVSTPGDCDDADGGRYPGAPEICDGDDNDCDGATDESGSIGESIWYYDGDGDGTPGEEVSVLACAAPPDYFSAPGVFDCDDDDYYRNPDVEEKCDATDWDCDGSTTAIDALGCVDYHRDSDFDGFGVDDDYLCLCSVTDDYRITPTELAADGPDCCDEDYDAKPSATGWSEERTACDDYDWNCDGEVTRRWGDYGICGGAPLCGSWPFEQGWRGFIPTCGYTGSWLTDCDVEYDWLDTSCVPETTPKTQQCR